MEGGTQNFIEDDWDLQDVKAILDQQPKSKSPPLARVNVKRIMNDQQNVLLLDGQFAIAKGYGGD